MLIYSIDIIQMCSGITRGGVLNEELYAQRFQTLIYLHLFTDCVMKISPVSSEQIQLCTNTDMYFVLTIEEKSPIKRM